MMNNDRFATELKITVKCDYCEKMSLVAPKLLQGKDMSETYGEIYIECIQTRKSDAYYITADCHDNNNSETYNINYCPMCGRKLNES